ncbi:MAG TPA: ZIP family metal transporter, partial [Noviherbaspirillum sp.]|nr:ZIP family metal transporter [Noviherbaspirillum sp.]
MAEPTLPDAPQVPPDRQPNPLWLTWAVVFVMVAGLTGLFIGTQEFLYRYDPRIGDALRGGMVAALATFAGTLPVLVSQQFSQ